MQTLYIVTIFILILCFIFLIYFFNKKLKELKKNEDGQAFTLLNQNIQGLQQRLDRSTESLNERLDNAARVIMSVNKELGQVQEIGRNIKEFQEFLNSPKLRGNIGEQVLNDSLSKVFSKEHFNLQYKFREGQVVDAIIKTKDGIIPIDSKFPIDNFKKMMQAKEKKEREFFKKECVKSVKKYIDSIGKKYILPDEGTVDFAVMYVPSESIYYEIIVSESDLMDFAHQKKILLVSPHSFFHFLKVIMMGLERSQLQEQAHRIWELLKGIQQSSSKFSESLGVLNRHITNAKNSMDNINSEYTRFSSQIDQVKLLK